MSHTKCRSHFLAATIALVLSFGLTVDFTSAQERPNIILCMGDDHGWDETGYYGHPHLKTPVLDEMAATGLRLDHFYSAHPSCSPTRGSVLTGATPESVWNVCSELVDPSTGNHDRADSSKGRLHLCAFWQMARGTRQGRLANQSWRVWVSINGFPTTISSR